MTEFFLTVFIFVGVIAVTALVFGGWIVINLIRGIWSMLGFSRRRASRPLPAQGRAVGQVGWQSHAQPGPFVPPPPAYFGGLPAGMVQCGLPGCRHVNPASARFCRRCGHAFPQAQRTGAVAARRAAYASS